MRKIIVSVNTTLDGFMAGPNCELDWHFNYWNEEMAAYASKQLKTADTILLGRITYTAMSAYWPSRSIDMLYSREDINFADMMNSYRKVVFSRSLQSTDWNNSVLVRGNLQREVRRLKEMPGKEIIVFGSASIIAALMRMDMIDEYVLWIHPVILGKGKPAFKGLASQSSLELVTIREFDSGVVILYYRKNGQSTIENINYGKIFAER